MSSLVGESAERNEVSIHAILQNPIVSRSDMDFVVTTEEVALSKVTAFARDVANLSFAKEMPLFMPMI